jgi:hypothetical protein
VSESPSGEHQELLERFQAEVSEEFAASGAPTGELTISNVREATEQAAYVVEISNETDSTCTVMIAYQTSNSSDWQRMQKDIPGGELITFMLTSLGQCDSLVAYAWACYVDGQLAFISPEDLEENGPWTPERISKEFPGDTDPCSDGWLIRPA